MLLMLAVPSSLSCRDLLQFVAPFQADIEHIKIIRDSIPNQYMVLIKFKSQVRFSNYFQEVYFSKLLQLLCTYIVETSGYILSNIQWINVQFF